MLDVRDQLLRGGFLVLSIGVSFIQWSPFIKYVAGSLNFLLIISSYAEWDLPEEWARNVAHRRVQFPASLRRLCHPRPAPLREWPTYRGPPPGRITGIQGRNEEQEALLSRIFGGS